MRRLSIRRVPVLSFSLALAMTIAVPGLVLADPPVRNDETQISLNCPIIETDDGAAAAFASSSSLGFSDAAAAFWLTPPSEELPDPDLLGLAGVDVDGLTLSAEIPLEGASGPDAGHASLTATLTPIGDPEPFSFRDPGFRVRGTEQFASVEGTLVISGDILAAPATFDLAACSGFIVEQTTIEHFPDTGQDVHDEIQLDCDLDDGEGTTGFLSAFTFIDEGFEPFGGMIIDLTPEDPSDEPLSGDVILDITGADATFELFNPNTGEIVGEATLTVAFTIGSTAADTRIAQNYVQKMTATTLSVDGSLEVTIGDASHEFPLDSCSAFYLTFHNIFHDPSGPKPSGSAPANDAPDGAMPLEVGDSVHMPTGGAAIPPEAPCLLEFSEQVFESSWGRTVWFTVEGTGEPITIDPTGSNFDTALAAYAGDELEHVGCIDDDLTSPFATPQASLTIDTVEGETYYIQVGGFDLGPLIEEEPNPEFGQLRLEIR